MCAQFNMCSKADFIHCNQCLIQTNINDNNYYLTQCGAIYCQQCVSQFSRNCLKCDQNQCQRILLVNAIKTEQFQAYFRDSPASQTIKHLQKVEEFQRIHRKNLIDGLTKQLLESKREITKLNNDLVAVKNENESLKSVIQNMQNQNLMFPESKICLDQSLQQNLNETNMSFKSLFDFNSQNAPQNVSEITPMSPASNQSSVSMVSSRYFTNKPQSKPSSKYGSIGGSINSRITLASSRKNEWKSNSASQQLSHSLFNAYTPSASSSRSSSTITPVSSMASNKFGSNNRFLSDMRPKLTRTVYD